ncbi:hypothetical protein [Streptomyces sp. NPDC058066]|uniref:hypothetical protein n=1 Tax=Streptomyces sp. NPDC058066 TaxID=3346323 RepID=UPI0036E6F94E
MTGTYSPADAWPTEAGAGRPEPFGVRKPIRRGPGFEQRAAGRRATGTVAHAGPPALVAPRPERLPRREADQVAFQQVHLLAAVVGDHCDCAGARTRQPTHEPGQHSGTVTVPRQHPLLGALVCGFPPRHSVSRQELEFLSKEASSS